MPERKTKIYFASDVHLGAPDNTTSLVREKHFVKWLEMAAEDATEIYLLGDVFDFWFEYRHVVPKGFVRLLGCLANLTDKGVKIHFFTGNHDMWTFGYLEKECGLELHREPIVRSYEGKKFFIGHGDGLGKGDLGYKMLKRVFASKVSQRLFAFVHPWYGVGVASYFSHKSRIANGNSDEIFLGEDGERLIGYCKKMLKKEFFDYFIFGHRHLPLDICLDESSRYLNTGEWVRSFSYLVFEDQELKMLYYPEE